MQRSTDSQLQARRITLIGAVIDAVLGLLKIGVGIIAHSTALVADGIHSLSDLLSDGMVIIIIRYSQQKPDSGHPWGHSRFETLGTVILGCILVAVAGAMAYESLALLFRGEPLAIPEWPALLIAAVSVFAKEAIFRYTLAVGKRIKSDLLIANAWHSRTDALSSIVVFIGVAGAMSGLVWLDSVAAVLVALIVARIGWQLTWKSIRELVDTALPEDQLAAYTRVVLEVEGVVGVHSFKSRTMGNQSMLELHIQVAPYLSASEGHHIGDSAVCRLKDRFEDIGFVIVHIDTYDDAAEREFNNRALPMRTEISMIIRDILRQHKLSDAAISRLTLHYQREQIHIDLMLQPEPEQIDGDPARIEQLLVQSLQRYPWFGSIRLWLAADPTPR